MWMRLVSLSLAVPATVFALSQTPLAAADWPEWGGNPAHNMISGEKGLPETFRLGKFDADGVLDLSTSENVKWSVRLGSETHGSPVIAQGRVFVGSNYPGDRSKGKRGSHMAGGWLLCLDEKTGRLIWELVAPKLPENRAPHSDTGYGICSSVTVDGNRLYVVTNCAEVLCLDMAGMANGNDGPFQDEGLYMAGAFNQPKSPPAARGGQAHRCRHRLALRHAGRAERPSARRLVVLDPGRTAISSTFARATGSTAGRTRSSTPWRPA